MKRVFILAALLSTNTAALASDGKAIYDKSCFTCHAAAVAGAPKLGDKVAWEPRLAKGMDTLVSSVTTGLNAMPPNGMCNDCSAEDFKAAIEYMSQ